MDLRSVRRLLAAAFLSMLFWPAAAHASVDLDDPAAQWLPRSDGAEWIYAWSNSEYSQTPRRERYFLSARTGRAFRIHWNEIDLRAYDTPSAGFADFKTTDAGLVNTNYQSTQPPPQFPLLCATANQCGNSLIGTYFTLFWGTRSPVLAEPLVRGTSWNSQGGANNDVAARNRYVGRETIVVPAFPAGIRTAKIESDVSQAGALGDPFGSGLRTVWWAYGIGPVKIVFRHTSGETTQSELQSTTLAPRALPSDENLLPLTTGGRATFRWRNSKHMRAWSRQRFTVANVVSNTARVEVEDLSGPIGVDGTYVFSSRLGGVTGLSRTFRSASTPGGFPDLGPRRGPNGRWRFVTPYDLMVYGFNPIVPAYATRRESWRSSIDSRDWRVFGVTGVSKVLGRARVRTPAGKFRALAVRSTLRQKGSRFGSGSRTSYFAPGRGLVKLVFRHDDGSVSTVERTR
jgi:hypothetical protein